MRRLAALCAATVVLAQPALAQDVDCANAETQMEMTFCAEQDWQTADADLNEAYAAARAVMRKIDAGLPKPEQGAEANLREGQRAWVTFRDATCAAEGYAMHGGSAEPMLIYSCRARLTQQRSGDLWVMAEEY
jgi:uncharacterized protein YecT (DUF1311 family)